MSNLPIQLTSFVGRQTEIAEVTRLLAGRRLLTLTGPGGSGKTRLALEVGRVLNEQYRDGVWVVDFSQINRPSIDVDGAARAIAAPFGLLQNREKGWLDTLVFYFQARELLLILDNCEHLTDVIAPLVRDLLTRTSPGLKILATSQTPLGVPGEVEWQVPALGLPEANLPPDSIEALMEYPALALFVMRAAESQPSFRLTQDNAPMVIEICRKLDGIPLAIELAAARVKFLGVDGVNGHLSDRLTLLAAPSSLVAARHQTLQAAVDWSYHLLSPDGQTLLCRLSIFSGSWSLEAAQAVCAGGDVAVQNVLVCLCQLVDHSLVTVLPGDSLGSRFRLLETIRLYGLAKINDTEQAVLRVRHLDWYTREAEVADQHIHGPDQKRWIDRMEKDLPNFHAALEWAADQPPGPALLAGLRLAGALCWFWRIHGDMRYGSQRIEALLARVGEQLEPEWAAARAYAHYGLGWLAYVQGQGSQVGISSMETSRALWQKLLPAGNRGFALATSFLARLIAETGADRDRAMQLVQESGEIFKALRDGWGEGETLFHLGIIHDWCLKDLEKAEQYYRQAQARFQQVGDSLYLGLTNLWLGDILFNSHRLAEAHVLFLEAFRHLESIGFGLGACMALVATGNALLEIEDFKQAEERFRQALPRAERIGIPWNLSRIHDRLGLIRLSQQRDAEALDFFQRSLQINRWTGSFFELAVPINGIAAALVHTQLQLAAQLVGYAAVLLRAEPHPEMPFHKEMDRRFSILRHQLGEALYQKLQGQGEFLTVDRVLEMTAPSSQIPEEETPPPTPRKAEKAQYAGLTAREREIAVLIMRGMTNMEIANELMISERTVTTHITNILGKLGFTSRAQVSAWVVEMGLAEYASGK